MRVQRITPACAGKSRGHDAGKPAPWDHPRVCGEKASITTSKTRRQGSPPRMRGKVWDNFKHFMGEGITPAYAGKRLVVQRYCPLVRDHPRVCGEKYSRHSCRPTRLGSPPRMRGKVDSIETGDLVHGITPAYAGKSQTTVCFNDVTRDHPRVCGEKGLTFHQMLRPTGSPPRMRGKVDIAYFM